MLTPGFIFIPRTVTSWSLVLTTLGRLKGIGGLIRNVSRKTPFRYGRVCSWDSGMFSVDVVGEAPLVQVCSSWRSLSWWRLFSGRERWYSSAERKSAVVVVPAGLVIAIKWNIAFWRCIWGKLLTTRKVIHTVAGDVIDVRDGRAGAILSEKAKEMLEVRIYLPIIVIKLWGPDRILHQ